MRRIIIIIALALGLIALTPIAGRAATAAAVRILSDDAVEAGLRAAATAFTARTGQDVTLTVAPAPALQKRLRAGETPDLAVASSAAIALLTQAGRIDAEGHQPIGRVGQTDYVLAPLKTAPVTAGAKAFAAYLREDGQAVLTANGVARPGGL